MSAHEVIVVGAGIVGAACALALQQRGLQVLLLDQSDGGCGVTAAGMGHLVALDESPQELAFCIYSLGLWQRYLEQHPGLADYHPCGTLWVAESAAQWQQAEQRAGMFAEFGWPAELIPAGRLADTEPALRQGLHGGLRVTGDAVIFAPLVVQQLIADLLKAGGQYRSYCQVSRIHDGGLSLQDGRQLQARQVVLATALGTSALLPEVPVFGRKGHLAISDRYPGWLRHQVVSMAYGQTAMGSGGLTVAANVQPRPNGQWLIGSCRQDGQPDNQLDMTALAEVLRSAATLLPALADMRILRAWAGMRPATPDGHPFIGAHPGRAGVWLATGHEGLGVTTAFGTAALLADLICATVPAVDGSAYAPAGRLKESHHV